MFQQSRGSLPVCRHIVAALVACFIATSAQAIDAPASPRGTELAQSTVKWEWNAVPGAVHYEVTIDGVAAEITTNRHVIRSDVWTGDHSMSVRARGADGALSAPSATAKIVVRRRFERSDVNRSVLVKLGAVATESIVAAPASSAQDVVDPPSSDNSRSGGLVDPRSQSAGAIRPGYELVFSDEFNGRALDPARWHTQLRWDGEFNGTRYEYRQINGEDQFYVNTLSPDAEHREKVATVHNPFEFDGSRLAIRATRNPLQNHRGNRTHGALMEMASQQSFLSGALSTYDKFAQKYGYFEARIKIPAHVGTFPAFWLFHQKRAWEGTYRSEIDIMENLGHAPWYVYNSFHYFTGVTRTYGGNANFLKPQPQGQIYTGTDYSRDYHVYAVDWEPGRIRWLIDNVVVSELYSEHVNYEELHLIINLAMGGNWTNFPANAGGLGRSADERYPTPFDLQPGNFANPALEIDYVRVYKRR